MALTFSNISSGSSTTASTNNSILNITAEINSWLLVSIAIDNSGINGTASLLDTITDTSGNIYTLLSKTNRTAGVSNDGTTLGIWLGRITTILNNGNITFNFSSDTSTKCYSIKKITVGNNEWVTPISISNGFTGSGTAFSSSAISVISGYTIFGATAMESYSAITADSDTTNGSWSTAYSIIANNGSDHTLSQSLSTQQKTVTATGNQTYNTSTVSTRDWALNTIIFAPTRAKSIIFVL